MFSLRRQTLEGVMLAGVGAAAAAMLMPGFGRIGYLGMLLALLAWLFLGRQRQGAAHFLHPLWLGYYALVSLLLLSARVSPDAALTFGAVGDTVLRYALLAPPLTHLLCSPEGRRRVGAALALVGLVGVVCNAGQYAYELAFDPARLAEIMEHRRWSDALVFFFPFLLLSGRNSQGWQARGWYFTAFLATAMIIGTGARGAWLALLAALFVWLVADREYRPLIQRLLLGIAVVGVLAYLLLPSHIVADRVKQGFDSSSRVSGTWGPSLKMMADHPWQGYGYGQEIFHAEFNRRAPNESSWSFKTSLGPHSIYLEVGFAAGVPALLLLLGLVCGACGCLWRAIKGNNGLADADRFLALATACSWVAFYVVRGSFESVRWGPLFLLLPLAVALHREVFNDQAKI